MNTTTQASRFIPITNPDLRFMGRIDRTPADHQTWAFPYTQVSFRCTGTSIGVRLVNHWGYGDAYLGAIIDGMQVKSRVPIDGAHDGISMENGYPSRVEPTGQQDDGPRHPVDVAIAADLPNIEHEVTIFKRQDEGNNRFDVYGILLDEGAKLMPTATPLPERRIEVYGDSVTCGERCEAACYVGQADPEVDLSPYSNAWYSYAAITARNLGAQAHLVSQGGTTLLDGIGWFHAPDYIGMESIWDKSVYNTQLGGTSPWDFAQYTPHVVVVALGQNDAHPRDFMADDYDGEEATHWRARYVDFVHALRGKYPHALIVLATTVLIHDPSWDRAIDEVCHTVNDEGDDRVQHFLYSRNAAATPGHPRVAEQQAMADELTAYLESFGPDLWK